MLAKIKPVRPNNGKTAHFHTFLAAGGTALRVGQAIYGGIAQDKTTRLSHVIDFTACLHRHGSK